MLIAKDIPSFGEEEYNFNALESIAFFTAEEDDVVITEAVL